MKSIAVIISLLVCFGFQSKAQTSCTIVLKDHSVIEAYHVGSTEICKKGRKKSNSFDRPISICGIENNSDILFENFSLIEEIRIVDYTPILNDAPNYNLTISIKCKNGDIHKITNAQLICKESDKTMVISQLPLQIMQSEQNLQQINVDIRNIETLIF